MLGGVGRRGFLTGVSQLTLTPPRKAELNVSNKKRKQQETLLRARKRMAGGVRALLTYTQTEKPPYLE